MKSPQSKTNEKFNELPNVMNCIDSDINECNLTPVKCNDQTSDCMNQVGSYSCICKNGFVKADNGTCVRK